MSCAHRFFVKSYFFVFSSFYAAAIASAQSVAHAHGRGARRAREQRAQQRRGAHPLPAQSERATQRVHGANAAIHEHLLGY